MQPDTGNLPIRDIHLPEPVSWWPPALGWWLLLILVVIAVALIVWRIKRRRLFKLRNTARTELDALYQAYQKQYDAKRFACELSVLLRRVCISYFPGSDVAGLTGTQWLEFLDSKLSEKHNKSGQKYSDGVGSVLNSAPYQDKLKNSDIDADALYRLTTEWIDSLGPVLQPKPRRSHAHKEAAHVSV